MSLPKVLTYNLTEDERKRVAEAARAEHTSVSQWVARAIRQALARR